MQCLRCPATALIPRNRLGVEIDCCPACRGVWLDRGELDKLIELSTTADSHASDFAVRRRLGDEDTDAAPHPAHSNVPNRPHRSNRKKSWLDELFD